MPPTREKVAEVLQLACGNITHAADILKISKVHAMRLVKRYQLRMQAREMRCLAGIQPQTGRPRVKKKLA